jgi:PAS domain S-box-containing protein
MTGIEGSALLAGDGGMRARVRAHGWSATLLGPVEAWSQSLRTVVRLILQAKQPMFVAWGPDLTLIYNDEYAMLLGAKHPKALGQPFRVVWSDIWPQFGPLVQRVMAGEALSFEDLPITMRRNGYMEDTWFSFSYTPVRDGSGRIAGLFCACAETTTKVRGEQKLRANEAQLEAHVAERTAELDRIWRLSQDLLAVTNAEGRFVRFNPAWERVLGWSADEFRATPFLDLVHSDDLAATVAEVQQLAKGVITLRFENRYRTKQGSYRWLQWAVVPEDGLFYSVTRDVTVEKKAAEALHQAEEALRQSQKMEAVGQLTGGLAHDFNNLLAGISGSLELMQARVAQGRMNDVERYIVTAQGASKRAAALTHRLLAFTRRQTLDPKSIDVNRLVAGMEELVRRTVGAQIEVEVVGAAGLWATLVDPNQLENALLNLCINARDAMPDGGRLTIETGNKCLDERTAHSHDLRPGQYVSLCVSDTGTGMTPEVTQRAFDPFFTTKPIGMGTGLGLSMIYGFVQQSGGQARICSELGQGAMVCLYLPRHHGKAEAEHDPAGEAAVPRAEAGETVLVVDDEPTVRMLVTEVLEDLGYIAIEAADGPGGLQVLRSNARIDLLVTDVGLPGGLNGRQVADAGRAVRPDLKVLFITGYAENAVLSHGHLDPGMQVLTKPFAMEALASRIKQLIAGQQGPSP